MTRIATQDPRAKAKRPKSLPQFIVAQWGEGWAEIPVRVVSEMNSGRRFEHFGVVKKRKGGKVTP